MPIQCMHFVKFCATLRVTWSDFCVEIKLLLCTLQLWNELLNVSNSDQVTSSVQKEWQSQLQLVIEGRVYHAQV